ncbi:MAG: DUF1566 domain-containing protein [Proteobacteria bacterium]|nr:DUF1566 domain-containing protein [Pseudomonadota bacterium]
MNPALVEVDALDGVTEFSAHLAIRENLSLPTCAAVQLEQHLEEVGTITELELWGNAPDPEGGCDGVDPWAGADGDADTDTDTDTDPQCAAEPDFAPCALDTTATAGADLSYDLCADGACVSPGTCLNAACNTTGPHGPIAADTPSGFVRSVPVAGEPVVGDPLTGLTWQGCEAGLSGAACDVGTAAEYDWVPAILYCDGLTWGGYDDWHLPNLYELLSIAGVDGSAPAFDPDAFPASSDAVSLFSIESCYTAPEKAFSFDPLYRAVWGVQKNLWGYRVRCVRGAAADQPLIRFARAIVDGRPVVADAVTGLMWQGCVAGQTGDHCTGYYPFGYTQPGAADYCDALAWGGHDDWRLPGAKELASLNDLRAGPPAVPIDPGAFPSNPTQFFWVSSAGPAAYEDTGQTVVFERVIVLGGMYTVIWPQQRRTTTSALVRCVREAP